MCNNSFAFHLFLKEANFIGKEALLKHKEAGIKKKLCFLTVDTTDVDPEGNETIWFGGKVNLVLNFNIIVCMYDIKVTKYCAVLQAMWLECG